MINGQCSWEYRGEQLTALKKIDQIIDLILTEYGYRKYMFLIKNFIHQQPNKAVEVYLKIKEVME